MLHKELPTKGIYYCYKKLHLFCLIAFKLATVNLKM